MRVRTRFAPSPTGELHLGNARTAVLNWLFSRKHGGRFILRFEDTDVERRTEGAEAAILEGLDWLGLDRDEDPVVGGAYGPYRQSERLAHYTEQTARLLERGLAYRCYCLPEELEGRRAARRASGLHARYDGRCRRLSPAEEEAFRREGRSPAVRFRVEPRPVTFCDRLRGEVTIDGAEVGDAVILRSDGRPTYNFAVVVDDLLMEVTHVIRGSGHLANTPIQILLCAALEGEAPEFVHVPDVLAPGGEKLSKRAGAPGLSRYRAEGYHPDAVVNYLSLLSWSAPDGREELAREELVREIDLDRLGTSQPILDPEKMRWLSGRHIRREAPEVLAARMEPFVDRARYGLTDRDLQALAEVLRSRIHLLSEAGVEAERIFGEPRPSAEAASALAVQGAPEVLTAVAREWEEASAWTPQAIGAAIRAAGKRVRAKGGALYRPVRAALTGVLQGPELPDVAYALGRERAVARLREVIRPEREADA